MSYLPHELIKIIEEFLCKPTFLSRKNIKTFCRDNCKLYLCFHSTNYNQCKDLAILYELIKKYNIYQKWWENSLFKSPLPILIDILSSGCHLPYTMSTYNSFHSFMEKDILEIIRIHPESLNSTYGAMRCRTNISPLDMACVNTDIPLSIIELLIKNNANMYHMLKMNGYPLHILNDLNDLDSSLRKNVIKKIFKKNGFDKSILTQMCEKYKHDEYDEDDEDDN